MSLKFDNKTYSDKIVSCSVDVLIDLDLGSWVPVFNDDGPVYGPNGQWELDPDLPFSQCDVLRDSCSCRLKTQVRANLQEQLSRG